MFKPQIASDYSCFQDVIFVGDLLRESIFQIYFLNDASITIYVRREIYRNEVKVYRIHRSSGPETIYEIKTFRETYNIHLKTWSEINVQDTFFPSTGTILLVFI